jgi:hypothetical protein
MFNSLHQVFPSLSRIPYKVILLWIALVIIAYYVSVPYSTHPYASYSYQTQTALLSAHSKAYMPQAIVFIAMGKLAGEAMVEDAITAVRLIGHWTQHVYILTDKKECFSDLVNKSPQTEVISVPTKNSIMEIKTMKAEIFTYLPKHVEKVLYMDVDILITRNIGFFLTDLTHLLVFSQHQQQETDKKSRNSINNKIENDKNSNDNNNNNKINPIPSAISSTISSLEIVSSNNQSALPVLPLNIDFAAFYDAKGHYVGFCSGCEKWHSGVMFLTRETAEKEGSCMRAWAHVLSSGMFDTDQESLDFVEKNGSCPHATALPSRHLLFAKDYIAMIFSSGQTFMHLTAINRQDEMPDYFYREIVVPRLRNSLHPPLRPYHPDKQSKQC